MSEHARTPAVEAVGVRKAYPGAAAPALDGLDLTVDRGTVHGLLGHNGAGKTTAIRIMTTLLEHDSGSMRVAGHDVRTDGRAVRARIGLVGQYSAVDEDLTGRQNLVMFGKLGRLSGAGAARRADELLERFGLADAAGKRLAAYSGGMRRKLDLAAALLVAPEVLFVDEPTTGLDPAARRDVWDAVRHLSSRGTTVLLTTQYLEEADRLADHISLVANGRVVAEGTPAVLKARVGDDRLELAPAVHADADRVAVLVRPFASGEAHVVDGRVSVPVTDRGRALADVVGAVRDAGIDLADVAIRTPTLDDAFLELTGSGAEGKVLA
ncbi:MULTISPECIES: ATP-binding cassette domain-containing protein [Prauserella salsuginis group]|uniref:ATP-binding cassette domain-containing protein n=1 Tax=Prauserella salsuginis TaxID=387889 RepID=A0ABW6GBB1_9PSEU|nr:MULTISPECIES: ATP-binding cassette domain-containing protein [Prauserella salsuginis group]MCR3722431.1 ABC-2 type transport system ATP-binding protein [Prauserella flava]MCR3736873.1 ABC-2 type transport system ATP-binding protein [Prauserella salsuginis]